jgi:hypothetical protein
MTSVVGMIFNCTNDEFIMCTWRQNKNCHYIYIGTIQLKLPPQPWDISFISVAFPALRLGPIYPTSSVIFQRFYHKVELLRDSKSKVANLSAIPLGIKKKEIICFIPRPFSRCFHRIYSTTFVTVAMQKNPDQCECQLKYYRRESFENPDRVRVFKCCKWEDTK